MNDERCPGCGDDTDFCLGHNDCDRRIRRLHDMNRHQFCDPMGCDTAFDAAIERLMAPVVVPEEGYEFPEVARS